MSKQDACRRDASCSEEADYHVGYGRPPAQHRFRKGASGNPNGRPKSSTRKRLHQDIIREAFETVAGRSIEITLNGKKHRMTQMQALVYQIANQGLKGDTRSSKLFLDTMLGLRKQLKDQPTHEEWLDHLENETPNSIAVHLVSADGTSRKLYSPAVKADAESSKTVTDFSPSAAYGS